MRRTPWSRKCRRGAARGRARKIVRVDRPRVPAAHRKLVGEGDQADWVTCDSKTASRVADSRVHRYDRVVGFRESEETEAAMARDVDVFDSYEKMRTNINKGMKSHSQRVVKQAMLERWVMKCA